MHRDRLTGNGMHGRSTWTQQLGNALDSALRTYMLSKTHSILSLSEDLNAICGFLACVCVKQLRNFLLVCDGDGS